MSDDHDSQSSHLILGTSILRTQRSLWERSRRWRKEERVIEILEGGRKWKKREELIGYHCGKEQGEIKEKWLEGEKENKTQNWRNLSEPGACVTRRPERNSGSWEEPAKLSKSVLQSLGRKMLLAKAEYKVIFFSLLMLLWDLVKALICRSRNWINRLIYSEDVSPYFPPQNGVRAAQDTRDFGWQGVGQHVSPHPTPPAPEKEAFVPLLQITFLINEAPNEHSMKVP